MIERLNANEVYNPIRKHIQLAFDIVGDSEEMVEAIASDLKDKGFDEEKSRVLIFVQTRKGTEEATTNLKKALNDIELNYAHKVEYYHAGLDGIEREETYDNYKNGNTVILIATKAFGMGMDIKNIHFIYHLGPSSTFEDYLQEVGRAGRHQGMLHAAGYSDDNPLQSKCLVTRDDFKKQKDKLHKNQISWNQINQVRETIFRYLKKFKKLEADSENAFPLPLDLLENDPDFEDVFNTDTFFRVTLYWLEKLERIKLGVFTPTYLPITLFDDEPDFNSVKTKEVREDIERLLNALKLYKLKFYPSAATMMVDMGYLRDHTKIKSTTELFKIIFKAQKVKLICLEREIKLTPTVTRTNEIKELNSYTKLPMVEAMFQFSKQILKLTKKGDQVNLEGDTIDELIKEVSSDYFIPQNIFWEAKKKNNEEFTKEEIAKNQENDFRKKRSKFAFKLLGFLPKIKHQSVIDVENGYEKPKITQLIYNANITNNEILNELDVFKEKLLELINYIGVEYIKHNNKTFNIVDLILYLGIEDKGEEYFKQLIFIVKGLAYLKGGGDLVPMGIEMFLTNTSPLGGDQQSSSDFNVKQEFIESSKMKELRLIALECLSEIDQHQHDGFIKKYFQCGKLSELIALLEENIGENHPNLIAYREEALEERKKKLNKEQLEVYSAPINKNLQVIAGPGSGKTHTLILRIARLIQEEGVNPENILILAYNRAVVVELKDRLSRVFKELGYSKLIKRLKVFTFHGFVKFCVSERLEHVHFKQWTSTFLQITKDTPGLISQKLGSIRHVFVDEFQDITAERLDLLEKIADPIRTKVCVIGDPNQSIYGYERADAGGEMEPSPYYERFNEIYTPTILNLSINYRSYPEILIQAEKLLALNESKFPMPQLLANLEAPNHEDYCEVINYHDNKVDWKDKLMELINYKNDKGVKYKQIAIMYRSNDQVFRAYNILQNLLIPNVRLRIQGAKGNLFNSREFHYFISNFSKKESATLPKNYIEEIETFKNQIIQKYPNWDSYLLNIFHCIVLEFDKDREDDSKYKDLIEFIKEISSNDDGQYGKIYQQNISTIKKNVQDQEIIITTMHKVKGLEFDAVIIPPSFSNLPLVNKDYISIKDSIEEERRLYYVAYTRAKYKLVSIKYARELAMDNNHGFEFEDRIRDSFGVSVDEGLDKFTMYWNASTYGSSSFEFIRDHVKIGDEIMLTPTNRAGFTFWHAIVNNRNVALLSKSMVSIIQNITQVKGFIVSSIYVSTYDDTKYSDRINNTNYADNWTQEAIDRGYVYLIDFSGYGKET
ncbi:UvrD-helicase domain-containing protein [uncultured Dokdonia sp.]|uniref:UvrD-helicase domain-containing protein n=1 Tax=uncultured Dokdonia sp. TaxID=575653 RepID=UPI00262FD11B|nr:UvrD-helicase domain-containing protein [uncultured Dokdonia sp.]